MSELIPDFGFIAFICGGLALLTGLLVYRLQKSLHKQVYGLQHALAQESVTRKQIEEDFRALLRCSRNMGKRLSDTLPTQQETSAPTPLNFSFDPNELHAGDKVYELVERGLSINEVASICGLTRGEVDFLSRFFDSPRTPAASVSF